MHGDAEPGRDRAGQVRAAQRRVGIQELAGEGDHLGGELVRPPGPRPGRDQRRQPPGIDRGGGLVVRRPGEPEHRRRRCHRLALGPHAAHHLVLDLHQVAGVEELRAGGERLISHRLRPRVQACSAKTSGDTAIHAGMLRQARHNLLNISGKICLTSRSPGHRPAALRQPRQSHRRGDRQAACRQRSLGRRQRPHGSSPGHDQLRPAQGTRRALWRRPRGRDPVPDRTRAPPARLWPGRLRDPVSGQRSPANAMKRPDGNRRARSASLEVEHPCFPVVGRTRKRHTTRHISFRKSFHNSCSQKGQVPG